MHAQDGVVPGFAHHHVHLCYLLILKMSFHQRSRFINLFSCTIRWLVQQGRRASMHLSTHVRTLQSQSEWMKITSPYSDVDGGSTTSRKFSTADLLHHHDLYVDHRIRLQSQEASRFLCGNKNVWRLVFIAQHFPKPKTHCQRASLTRWSKLSPSMT